MLGAIRSGAIHYINNGDEGQEPAMMVPGYIQDAAARMGIEHISACTLKCG